MAIPHNLPPQLTPFVGRLESLSDIVGLLAEPACHLLTLVGPGGIGKTRLALEISALFAGISQHPPPAAPIFTHGIYFVDLQPLRSSDSLISTIADAIGFQFYPGSEPKQQLLDYLQSRRLMLLMDNFEHLLSDANPLTDIIRAARRIKILVTSRETLSLQEEWLYQVKGLDFPETSSPKALETYEAIQLFVQCARRVQPSFSLDTEAASVTRLCQLVEGMPLALEMTAAWLKRLPCGEIARELEQGLDILESPARNVLPRHRNMRVVIDHSWNLLTSEEQNAFKKLSVFRGGFSKAAAEAVAGASLHILSALVDKSLLRVDNTGRYNLHKLVRQYSEEHLRKFPADWEQAQAQHSHYYLQWMSSNEQRLFSREQKQTFDDIETEFENIRVAWDWAIQSRNVGDVSASTHVLWFFYDRDRWHEGERTFARAAAAFSQDKKSVEHQRALGKLLARQGALCGSLFQLDKAWELRQASVELLRPLQMPDELAFSLLQVGIGANVRGEFATARLYCDESLSIYRETGNLSGSAYTLHWLAQVCHAEFTERNDIEDLRQAKRFGEQSLDIFQQVVNPQGLVNSYSVLSWICYLGGEYTQSQVYAEKGLRDSQEVGIRWGITLSLALIARAAYADGDYEKARSAACLALKADLEYCVRSTYTVFNLDVVARMLLAQGQTEQAYELFTAIEVQAQKIGIDLVKLGINVMDKFEESLSDHLRTAIERGKVRDFGTVVEEVIAELRGNSEQIARTSSTTVDTLSLSEREREILQLVADGNTDREIAAHLVLSVKTIKWYLHEMYSKLSVKNRTQAVVRARELNLLP